MDKLLVYSYMDLLAIPRDADFSIQDIESNFKMLSKIYHPDMKKVDNAEIKFIELKNAKDYLITHYAMIKELIGEHKSPVKNKTKSNSDTQTLNQPYEQGIDVIVRIELLMVTFISLAGLIGQTLIAYPSSDEDYLGILMGFVVISLIALFMGFDYMIRIKKLKVKMDAFNTKDMAFYSEKHMKNYKIFAYALIVFGSISALSDFLTDPEYYTGEGFLLIFIGLYYLIGRFDKKISKNKE